MREGDNDTKGMNVRLKDTRFCTTYGPCAIYNVNAKR